MTDDILKYLDEVLAKSNQFAQLQKRKKQLQQAPKMSKYSGGVLVQKQQLEEINKQIDALIWEPKASVAFFVQQDCDACGSTHRVFLQYMQREVTGKVAKTTRWSRVTRPATGLPKEVIVQRTLTHICADCLDEYNFDLKAAEYKFVNYTDPFIAAPNYDQEEIDA